MRAGPDNEPLASPRNFFPDRKRRVAELFTKLLGRSFLPFPHFAAVDHHIMRVALSLDLDLAKFDQSCFRISNVPLAPAPRQETGILRFEFYKRSQFFICTHNEALTVAAMRVNNPGRSSLRINR
jgi:hypothetical protein